MGEIKLDVDITRKQIEDMAKAVIRETVGQYINEALQKINIQTVAENKIKSMEGNIKSTISAAVKKYIDSMRWEVNNMVRDESRKMLIEEIQKVPMKDLNVYLKVSSENCY